MLAQHMLKQHQKETIFITINFHALLHRFFVQLNYFVMFTDYEVGVREKTGRSYEESSEREGNL